MSIDSIQLSKFLTFILRHRPDAIGLSLDSNGWARIDELIEKSKGTRTPFNRDDLLHVVRTSNKKRFSISVDGVRIRAAQGHSVLVDLGLQPEEPPLLLFHGTAVQFIDSILREGLISGKRRQVHLSRDEATALQVGQRHGKAVIIEVDALRMHKMGYKFYASENGVWLTDQVPPEFLTRSSKVADSETTSRHPKPSK